MFAKAILKSSRKTHCMTSDLLNEQALPVFVILAETLEKWKSPNTPEGKAALLEHYAWGAEMKAKGMIILAGPTNLELIANNEYKPIGQLTGLIMIRAASREEAVLVAERDPFHVHGYRRNTVHSMRISIAHPTVYETLCNIIL
jgi:uncharacterized protein YciI